MKKLLSAILLALAAMTGLAQDETLPDATINKGVATIKVKLLGYKPEMKKEFMVHGFTPLCSKSRFEKEFPFVDDGTVMAEIPLWLPRQVRVHSGSVLLCTLLCTLMKMLCTLLVFFYCSLGLSSSGESLVNMLTGGA